MARLPAADLPDDLPVRNALVEITYHNPEMHRGFASLSGRVHSASRLPAKLREVVVLRVAALNDAEFEWASHAPAALRSGVTDGELAALRRGDLSGFQGAERAAIEFAGAVEQRQVDDAAWAAAREHFSEGELVDMTMLAGFYGLASRFVLALGIGAPA